MKEWDFFGAAGTAADLVVVNWELVRPKILAAAASIGLFFLALFLSSIFYPLSEEVSMVVAGVLFLLWIAAVWVFRAAADLAVVRMARDLIKDRPLNCELCISDSMAVLPKYITVAVPLELARMVVISLAALAVYNLIPAQLDLGVRVASSFVDLLYSLLFLFLFQVISFEELDFKKTIIRCTEFFKRNPMGILSYWVLRWLVGFVAYALTALCALIVGVLAFIPAYSIYTQNQTYGYAVGGAAGLVILLAAGLIALAISSGITVLDTTFYLQGTGKPGGRIHRRRKGPQSFDSS